jgi:DNA-binding NtrC family response regulator
MSGGTEPVRLLIIDDEPGVTRLIESVARSMGLDVMAINETEQFEKALETWKPTIIFLDVAMPGRDGLELIGHLSARNYPGKIVIMSGSDPRYIQMSSTIAKTRGLAIAGTLAKPFRVNTLKALLTKVAEE